MSEEQNKSSTVTTQSSVLNPQSLITQIHQTATMAVVVVTGGGSQAIADLLAVPGASRTVLEALIPYSDTSLAEFLGDIPTQAVSVETAVAMARRAYQRACALQETGVVSVIGLSCTATLVTDRLKKGDHRAHIGLCQTKQTQVFSLTLEKGARDRIREERLVSDLLLQVLAVACGVILAVQLPFLVKDHLEVHTLPSPV